RECRDAQLVGRAQVDAVDLAVRRDRRQVDDARQEHDGQTGRAELANQRLETKDPLAVAAVVGTHQGHQGQVAVRTVGRPAEGPAIRSNEPCPRSQRTGSAGSERNSSGRQVRWAATVPLSRTRTSRLLVPGSVPAMRAMSRTPPRAGQIVWARA